MTAAEPAEIQRLVENLDGMLSRLRLGAIREQLDGLLEEAARRQLNLRETLAWLCAAEVASKEQRRLSMAMTNAHFPFVRTLEGFEFEAQPSIDPGKIRDLGTCRWVANGDNVVMLGPPGVGKTHLEVALGREAVARGYTVQFTTAMEQLNSLDMPSTSPQDDQLSLVDATSLPDEVVQAYDASREPSPRPHFLSDWLHHPAGTVLALVDAQRQCHGFGRIRPCLLRQGTGWRIGPLLADSPELAERLLRGLLHRHQGVVLLDGPGANPAAGSLLRRLGFAPISETLRMYRGTQPQVSLADVYGLACLELR